MWRVVRSVSTQCALISEIQCKFPVVVSTVKVLFQFHIIFRNKIVSRLALGILRGRGRISLLGNEDALAKMSQYFEDKFLQISLNFWLSFTRYQSVKVGDQSLT